MRDGPTQGGVARRRIRSMLFVPGHRQEWLRSGGTSGADALVVDLEDSVPEGRREEARANLVEEAGNGSFGAKVVFVRVNAVGSDDIERDVDAVVAAGVDGVAAPKLETTDDVVGLAALVEEREAAHARSRGAVVLMPLLETAPAIYSAYELAMASERVVGVMGGAPRGADVNRAIGYQWTEEGFETLHIRSHVVLAARAAGVPHIISFPWLDLDDQAAFERETARARQLGYTGRAAIHPSHVGFVNAAFSPSAEEIAYYRGLVHAMHDAQANGHAAARYEGGMVDLAHLQMAEEVLALATGDGTGDGG